MDSQCFSSVESLFEDYYEYMPRISKLVYFAGFVMSKLTFCIYTNTAGHSVPGPDSEILE